jgi:hypothetical protein
VRRDVTKKAPGRLEEEIVSGSTSQNLLLLSRLQLKYPGNARNIEIERCARQIEACDLNQDKPHLT